MRLFIILLLSGISIFSQAQQTLFVKVTGGENKTPIPASILIKGTTQGYSTDTTGHRYSFHFICSQWAPVPNMEFESMGTA